MKFDYLIVGAGYSGCVIAERIATSLGKKVLIVEKREHIGGNAYDYLDEHGILAHKYGPHIFHTNSRKVWEYLSQFAEWRHYEHKVLAVVDGMKIPVPFNLNSLRMCFPNGKAETLKALLINNFGMGARIPILRLRESTSGELGKLADFIYEKVFYGYTVKQWGLRPDDLDLSVTARVPVLVGYDDRYFQDTYQGMPKFGYTRMFENMLKNPLIQVMLKADFEHLPDDIQFDKMVYTGPIDSFFGYVLGQLPYRSLRFEFNTLRLEFAQETGQVNYPNDHDYTRITEFKHLTGQKSEVTTVAFEYPQAHQLGLNDPYYPIPQAENDAMYKSYLNRAERIANHVIFVGRLAEYKYYNMDQVVARALTVFEKDICGKES